MTEMKLEHPDPLEVKLLTENYEALKRINPNHPALKAAIIKKDGIYLQQEFFKRYGEDPLEIEANICRYFVNLKIAKGSG